jgi:hypothetical protein
MLRPPRPVRLLALTLTLLLLGFTAAAVVPTAQAQITIDESDIRGPLLGQRLFLQEFEDANPGPAAQTILNATGPNQTYDLRPLALVFSGNGINQGLDPANDDPLGEARFVPPANFATRIIRGDLANPDSSAVLFENVTSSAVRFVGTAFLTPDDVNGDGNTPDTLAVAYTNPGSGPDGLLQLELPVTFTSNPTTAWSSTMDVATEILDGDGNATPLSQTTNTNDYEVTGYGTLVTPAGRADVLRIRRELTLASVPGGGLTQILFVSKDGRLSATLDLDAVGNPEAIRYATASQAGTTADVSAGATGPVTSVAGLSVELTTASSTPGTLQTFSYGAEPPNATFTGGSAQSGDGSTITPENVAPGYFVVEAVGLTGFAAEVCLSTSSVPGVSDVGTLIVGTRDDASGAIQPLDTTVDGTQVCATVSSFSEFFVTGGPGNALPVELAAFTATTDARHGVLAWTTHSETNNAGFVVEHAAPGAAFRDAGFVEGAGTTSATQRYAFRTDDALAPGTHRFRLRQVDFDGAATHSDPVAVEVTPAEAFTLSAAHPNPTRRTSALDLTLAEAQPVTVAVYDAMGRRVATLHEGPLTAQTTHTLAFDAAGLASGVYLVRVTSPHGTATRRVTVVR